jgi:hypothetical protein
MTGISRGSEMEREVKCVACGATVITRGTTTMYCEACRKRARNAQKNRYKKNAKERKKAGLDPIDPIYTCDSKERIEMCLNCKKITCNSGTCLPLRMLKKTRDSHDK